jgi:diaminopimelate decarboxylase
VARVARALPGVALEAVAMHIGSQVTSVAPFEAAFARMVALVQQLAADGIVLKRLDLGGGLGVAYNPQQNQQPDLAAYAAAVRAAARATGLRLVLEPGRWMVADAGILLASVIQLKDGLAKRFMIVDAAMNDLIRPSLYDAFHAILPVTKHGHAPHGAFDVVGPICESGDILAVARELPLLEAGDLVAFRHAGAYGAVMSSTYNTRPLAAEIMVRGQEVAVIRPRQDVTELIARDRLPDWLNERQG